MVASLYNRNSLKNLIANTVKNIFIPITVGGGIRSVEDANEIFKSGADKIAVNTAAVKNPKLISDLVNKFGSQSVIISISAKKVSDKNWEVLVENGRQRTGLNVIDWVKKNISMGVGEILLTSIDQEGTRKGYDIELIRSVTDIASVPVIASGGMGKPSDLIEAITKGNVDALSMADILHYNRDTIQNIKKIALKNNIEVRSNDKK